jgi:hypothetical protein
MTLCSGSKKERKTVPQYRRLELEWLESRDLLAVLHVLAAGGNDTSGNGSPSAPFQSIQRAINAAATNDTIKVAGGTYTYSQAQDQAANLTARFGFSAVAFIDSKSLTIIGGYTPADGFTTTNATANPTVIDAANARRGVVVTEPNPAAPSTALNLQNVTIQNGLATGIASRAASGGDKFGQGGGLLAELAGISVSNVIFQNNQAIGSNVSSGIAGAGAGGGVGIFSAVDTAMLNSITFTNNKAIGGGGSSGGFGQGGGLFTDHSNINGTNLLFTGNQALGGNSSSTVNGGAADGFGGAANFEGSPTLSFNVALTNITARNNQALGGNASVASATPGGGFGGGIGFENISATLTQAIIQNNLARGGLNGSGPGASARNAFGGGLQATNSNLTVERGSITGNSAEGGSGGPVAPAAGGGISIFTSVAPARSLVLRNTLVADNSIAIGATASEGRSGSAGGGLDVFGTSTTISASTFANNRFTNGTFNLQGQAISLRNGSPLQLDNSIIANHTNNLTNPAAALHVFADSSVTAGRNLFAANSKDTNQGDNGAGTFVGFNATNILTPTSAGFLDPASSDYRLTLESPAVNAAVNSSTNVDINNFARTTPNDLGAFELNSPNATGIGGTGANSGTAPPPSPPPDPPPTGIAGTADTVGDWDPSTGIWYLLNRDGIVNSFAYGAPGWRSVVGDWDGDGTTTVGVVDPSTSTWYLRNSNSSGAPDIPAFQYGLPGWIPVAGDWDGNGTDNVGIFDPVNAVFYLLTGTTANPVQFGVGGWVPVTGDWTGIGRDSIGVFDPFTANFYLLTSNGLSSFQFGVPGWKPTAGDWDGNGIDSPAVFDPAGNYYLLNGTDVTTFPFGLGGWTPHGGNWTGPAAQETALADAARVLAARQQEQVSTLDAMFTSMNSFRDDPEG